MNLLKILTSDHVDMKFVKKTLLSNEMINTTTKTLFAWILWRIVTLPSITNRLLYR